MATGTVNLELGLEVSPRVDRLEAHVTEGPRPKLRVTAGSSDFPEKASSPHAIVLDELYSERARVLDEMYKPQSKAPSDAKRHARASKYLRDLERYIDQVEEEKNRELGVEYKALDELNGLATKMLALKARLDSYPTRR